MSKFSIGQLNQLGNKLESAGWTPADLTILGQASIESLTRIRMSLSDIISAIEGGKTELWLAPGQNAGQVQGRVIYKHLIATNLLASCADLVDLEAVKAEGVDFFLKYFRSNFVFAWRGIYKNRVPCLCENDSRVVISWRHFSDDWIAPDLALRRK